MIEVLFIIAVFTLVGILAMHLRKSSAANRAELARKKREDERIRNIYSDKLAVPGNNLLANSDEVWNSRRKHMGLVSESARKTVGKRYFAYKPGEEPEYDGYSRSDRHHLTPARVKVEGHLEEEKPPGLYDAAKKSVSKEKGLQH